MGPEAAAGEGAPVLAAVGLQDLPDKIFTCVDSDWAGDRVQRTSTSGGTMCMGSHLIKSWSSTQNIVALASGKAEYYGLVNTSAMCLGIRGLLNDMGVMSP